MVKTNYREVLEFIAKDIKTMLNVEFEPYGNATAVLDGCKLSVNDEPMTCVGYGDFEEEACEDYFLKLQGKTLIFPYKNDEKYSFDKEFEKYRAYKKEEANKYISYEEYLLLIEKEALFTREIIEIYEIETKVIKGHNLYLLYGNEIYFAYEENCPELKTLETGSVIRIWYFTEHVSNYGNIIRKIDVIK